LKKKQNMKTLNLNKALIATMLVLTIPVAQAGDWTGNAGGSLGSKQLDNQGWGALDSHVTIGFMLDVKKKSWPVSLTYDLILSGQLEESGSLKNEAYTVENHFGVRKKLELENSSVRPYIGGGVALVYAETRNKTATSTVKNEDDAIGA
jgi:opacity protein-like surface antigen